MQKKDDKTISKNCIMVFCWSGSICNGLGPIEAVREACKKAKWNLDEIDLFEINEAFASQSIAVIRELGIDEKK